MKSPNRVGLWSHDLQVVLPSFSLCVKFVFITSQHNTVPVYILVQYICILFQCFLFELDCREAQKGVNSQDGREHHFRAGTREGWCVYQEL